MNPAAPIRLVCPACGKFLVTLEGIMVECPPCRGCGVQTTVRINPKRNGLSPLAPAVGSIIRDMETK